MPLPLTTGPHPLPLALTTDPDPDPTPTTTTTPTLTLQAAVQLLEFRDDVDAARAFELVHGLYLLWLYLLWLHLLWLHLPAGRAALPRGGRTCIVQLICDRYDGVLCTV